MAQFKKNIHRAKKIGYMKIRTMIKKYPSQYPTPKYMQFIKAMIEAKWQVKLYEARVSKYVFCIKGDEVYKIRFSNHKPLLDREEAEDCDYYVGISHKQVSTTEQIINKLNP